MKRLIIFMLFIIPFAMSLNVSAEPDAKYAHYTYSKYASTNTGAADLAFVVAGGEQILCKFSLDRTKYDCALVNFDDVMSQPLLLLQTAYGVGLSTRQPPDKVYVANVSPRQFGSLLIVPLE